MADIKTMTLPNGDTYNLKDYRISSISNTTATLAANSWSSKTQQVTVSGVTTNSILVISAAPASYSLWTSCGVYASAQAANKITFTCTETPSAAITANVLLINLA